MSTSINLNTRLLTATQTAKILGITDKTLWEWRQRGIIQSVKIPGTHRKYDYQDIIDLIEKNKSSK